MLLEVMVFDPIENINYSTNTNERPSSNLCTQDPIILGLPNKMSTTAQIQIKCQQHEKWRSNVNYNKNTYTSNTNTMSNTNTSNTNFCTGPGNASGDGFRACGKHSLNNGSPFAGHRHEGDISFCHSTVFLSHLERKRTKNLFRINSLRSLEDA